jgi:hypothetical protein
VIDLFDIASSVAPITLIHHEAMYITELILFKAPKDDSVNFSLGRQEINEMFAKTENYEALDLILMASTDEGNIISWNASTIRNKAEEKYRKVNDIVVHKPYSPENKTAPSTAGMASSASASASASGAALSPVGKTTHHNDAFLTGTMGEENEMAADEDEKEAADHENEEAAKELAANEVHNMYIDVMQTSLFGSVEMSEKLKSYLHWRAHGDSISSIITLADHGKYSH